jgi:hypothetical protein
MKRDILLTRLSARVREGKPFTICLPCYMVPKVKWKYFRDKLSEWHQDWRVEFHGTKAGVLVCKPVVRQMDGKMGARVGLWQRLKKFWKKAVDKL